MTSIIPKMLLSLSPFESETNFKIHSLPVMATVASFSMMTSSGVGKAKAEIVGVRVLLLLIATCSSTEGPLKYHTTIVNSYS